MDLISPSRHPHATLWFMCSINEKSSHEIHAAKFFKKHDETFYNWHHRDRDRDYA